jgi:hypothetical protein
MYGYLRSFLPQMISGSRKAMIWFLALSSTGILELCKVIGPVLHWSPDQILAVTHELAMVQAALAAIAALWTSQIAHEDAALKTGLPPPAAFSIPVAPVGTTTTATTTTSTDPTQAAPALVRASPGSAAHG